MLATSLVLSSIGGLERGIEHFRNKRWFPIKEKELAKAQNWYQRHGRWSLLLCWVPIIGDPITLAAGVMKEKLWIFTLLVTFSKTTRYLVIVYLAFK